ncbi:hypothetical protein [Desulfovermiculus halophilus]|uniref:hypothetical protein n=1 Tax=Desulfovermiculus halophilus TaxID=339722 RepID=UPI0004859413|nr:hypothetical protein [Desulfovermiculus halophilus]
MRSDQLRFEVPFLPQADYADFLAQNSSRLDGVYFSLHTDRLLDARAGVAPHSLQDMIRHLRTIRDTPKFALLNSRFQNPSSLLDPGWVDSALEPLAALHRAGCLDGIVYVDPYLLQALSDRAPDLCSHLQAVPGVNAMLDSLPRINQHLELITHTAFMSPGKLILDRSLNRDLSRLREISSSCARLWPGMRLGLLANEGCLPHCPFKLSHDAAISLGRMDPALERTLDLNTSLGCARAFARDPSLILRSPFIRPEDAAAYSPWIQTIKLGGRTRGAGVMRKVLSIYLKGAYAGNLLELMDTLELLAHRFYVANQDLPSDFGKRTMDCGLCCSACTYCASLVPAHVQDLGVRIKPMWG